MIGYSAILLALVLTCAAAFYYLTANRVGIASNRGGMFYALSAGAAGVAAAYFLYIILGNQFQYAYVYSYSSLDLPLAYKFSVFWAGQQGSFMLWLVFHVIFGLILTRQSTTNPGTMAVYSLVQVVLLVMLLVKSPFMVLAEPQSDGNGLNPLLQDPWMVIHPPIIFLGYAGFAVPFAQALGGLLSNKYREWVDCALPWALFSWSALGAGIFVGGYWAYKVLGWGGYWAWDPVENSSLVPWLAAGALVHLLFLARARSGAVKPAYFAVISTYSMVLYGTFLTRSGILSDFSTHSFADEGVGGLLGAMVLLAFTAAVIVLIIRWHDLPEGSSYETFQSREFMLAGTAMIFTVLAFIVFVGMSTPLFTRAIGSPQSVSGSFYNVTTLPLAIALTALLTVGPVLKWGDNNPSLKRYLWFAGGAFVVFVLAWSLGLRQPVMALTIAIAATALISNTVFSFSKKTMSLPAAVTHAGVAVALIGIIASSTAGSTLTIGFVPRESQEVFGRKITYLGVEASEDGKRAYQSFEVEDGKKALVRSITKFNKEGRDAAREPGIYRGLTADVYFAPGHKHDENPVHELILVKGEQTTKEGLALNFIRLNMSGRDGGGDIKVQTLFEVTKDGKTEEINPEITYNRNGKVTSEPIKVFGYKFMLGGVNPREGSVLLGMQNIQSSVKEERLDVEISQKPLINLVWLGTVLITFATAWGAYRRVQVDRQKAMHKINL